MAHPFANLPVTVVTNGLCCPTCGERAFRYVAYYHGLTHSLVRCQRGHWFLIELGAAPPPSHPRRLRVLVVEPDQPLRDLFCMCLASEFVDVNGVPTRAEAIRSALESRPAVITTELRLPDGDALPWCRTLKAPGEAARPGIVVVTGDHRAEQLAAAARVADAVFLKPCMPDVYVREVLRLVGYEPSATTR